MADEKAGPIARGQETIKNMLEGLTPGAPVLPTLKNRILDKIKELGDLSESTTKLLNKYGIETPLQKQQKKNKKKTGPQNAEIISAKAGRLIKCGAQMKGTSPLIRKKK